MLRRLDSTESDMCMYDYSEPAQLLSASSPKARKDHKCDECRRVICKGEIYKAESTLYEGEFSAHKTCTHCMVAREWLSDECGGYVWSAVVEDIGEHVSERKGYDEGVDLARMYVGMRRKWQRFDGAGLLKVPKMPALTPPYVPNLVGTLAMGAAAVRVGP